MWVPEHQAAFFRLLSDVLYYIVSGSSRVGIFAAKPWTPHCRPNTTDVIPEESSGSDTEESDLQIEVYKCFFAADSQTRPMYDCIQVRSFGEQQIPLPVEEMDEDGEVDDESDAGDSDLDEDEWREAMEVEGRHSRT
jgi:hypothetical protein